MIAGLPHTIAVCQPNISHLGCTDYCRIVAENGGRAFARVFGVLVPARLLCCLLLYLTTPLLYGKDAQHTMPADTTAFV